MNTISFFAFDVGVTPVSLSMPGVSVCTAFDPGDVGSGGPTLDTTGCQVLCIDTALVSGLGMADFTEANGFGMLIMCYQTIGLSAGGSRTLTIRVAANGTVSENTRFRAFYSDFASYYGMFSGSLLTPSNAPFDNDVLGMMAYILVRTSFSGETLNLNPYELLAYPINNSSRLVGIAGGITGSTPDGSDTVSGVLAESGVSVQVLIGMSIGLVGAVWLVQQRQRKHYVLRP